MCYKVSIYCFWCKNCGQMIEDYYDKLVGFFVQELFVIHIHILHIYWVVIIQHQTVLDGQKSKEGVMLFCGTQNGINVDYSARC